jgi:hypothetical protein
MASIWDQSGYKDRGRGSIGIGGCKWRVKWLFVIFVAHLALVQW